jgi:hypothetical protein
MIEISIERLQYLCDTIPQLLSKIDESTFSIKPEPNKWSKKEIIGHLIDSATNNHHRLVRSQFEDVPTISYDQNEWNKHNYYQQIDGKQIISFWTAYNLQLLELIKLMPKEMLGRDCRTGDAKVSLEVLIQDYLIHLEHHLHQVVDY